ncbi:sterol O-acyltransferase 1-like isoform X1 [Haliotis cracherodii]|uniref:sterol O-acyltransferase 1-like isoform X1 n=1 Tax=Haliotis cracherodii TaxID=6455 RepID=UPI0039E863D4
MASNGPSQPPGANGDLKNAETTPTAAQRQVNLQRIRDQAQRLKGELHENLNKHLDELFESFVAEVELIEQGSTSNGFPVSSKSVINKEETLIMHKRRKDGDLPDKVFVNRRSVLTELFEINHIRTIYHIFVAILVVFSLNTIIFDWVEQGRLVLDFDLIQWGLGKLPKVMALWVCMKLSTLLVVYPAFYYWSTNRVPGKPRLMDYIWLVLYILYECLFLMLPIKYVAENELPPASTLIIACEQLRLCMKTHAFVRTNMVRLLNHKKDESMEEPEGGETTESRCPGFSKYLYFLFAPTLIYRDSYPRTHSIRWKYVVSNFTQVFACLMYTYYIFERFCIPYFRKFNKDHVTPKALMLSAFGCMLPGTLVLFIGFFAILHSWLNAFAEMLRFGDRLFYKDWWNSTTFSNYYRTWNVVVHDWLYTYIYKDFCRLFGHQNRAAAMGLVFLISAVFHEYVLIISFGFFYPVLFVMFAGAGFGFIFLTDKGSSRSWNVFLWVALFIGNGLLMCLYSMEWYARRNCPVNSDSFIDYLIPRSWTCMI